MAPSLPTPIACYKNGNYITDSGQTLVDFLRHLVRRELMSKAEQGLRLLTWKETAQGSHSLPSSSNFPQSTTTPNQDTVTTKLVHRWVETCPLQLLSPLVSSLP